MNSKNSCTIKDINWKLNQRQNFSLPSTIMYYILKTPTSTFTVYLKLYKSCKYFYNRNKIFFTTKKSHKYDHEHFLCYGEIARNVSFWLHEKLRITECYELFPSHQIYRCTVQKLYIESSEITLNDFLIIVKENTIKDFCFLSGFIKDLDGSIVAVDVVLQNLLNVEWFVFSSEKGTLNKKQLQNTEKINLWNKFQKFNVDINFVSEHFDPMPLLNFIRNNAVPDFQSQIIIDGKNAKKNYEMLKASAEEVLLQKWNGNCEMEIYQRYVPLSILRERIRKSCEDAKAGKNPIKKEVWM